MSFPTTSAYIQNCKGWEPRLREHPAMDWMFDFCEAFDNGDMKSRPYTEWHTEDFTLYKENGKVFTGAEAWAADLEAVAPFAKQTHEPVWLCISETPTGYEFVGNAKLFFNLLVPGEKSLVDVQGREWDGVIQGMFHFTFVRDPTGPKGLKMSVEKVFADGSPVISLLLKRGMLKPEELIAKLG